MKVNISQSLIKDIMAMNSPDSKDIIKPVNCPKWIKYKYVDGLETKPSDAMLYGKFFEWHLLGATRDGIEPIIPRIGVKDQRPTKSASKNAMLEYIMEKAPDAVIKGTGKRIDLKPKPSAKVEEMINYITLHDGYEPTERSKKALLSIIELMPDNFGEPEITTEDLFKFIQTMPIDLNEGTPSTQEIRLLELVEMAKEILSYMGLDVDKGEKQLFVKSGDISGSLDWVSNGLSVGDKKAIYDVKFTKTKIDDWRNGWGEPETKEDAKIQATHYTHIYHKKYGKFIPFYFIVFGEDGWIKVLRYKITKSGLQSHIVLIDATRDFVKQMVKEDFKPKPAFNRCLFCDFNEICNDRSVLPEIETIIC